MRTPREFTKMAAAGGNRKPPAMFNTIVGKNAQAFGRGVIQNGLGRYVLPGQKIRRNQKYAYNQRDKPQQGKRNVFCQPFHHIFLLSLVSG